MCNSFVCKLLHNQEIATIMTNTVAASTDSLCTLYIIYLQYFDHLIKFYFYLLRIAMVGWVYVAVDTEQMLGVTCFA
jgi:hypothetical protein